MNPIYVFDLIFLAAMAVYAVRGLRWAWAKWRAGHERRVFDRKLHEARKLAYDMEDFRCYNSSTAARIARHKPKPRRVPDAYIRSLHAREQWGADAECGEVWGGEE